MLTGSTLWSTILAITGLLASKTFYEHICFFLFQVRETGELELEEELYAKLIFLYRSPETLIKWTRRWSHQSIQYWFYLEWPTASTLVIRRCVAPSLLHREPQRVSFRFYLPSLWYLIKMHCTKVGTFISKLPLESLKKHKTWLTNWKCREVELSLWWNLNLSEEDASQQFYGNIIQVFVIDCQSLQWAVTPWESWNCVVELMVNPGKIEISLRKPYNMTQMMSLFHWLMVDSIQEPTGDNS